ncbi:MAG: hypothetical protein HYR75_06300 [Gemmatimonadetes bacterium]|nr:hypothetical protein [Gemmatimonadota bacterium]MBI3569423.1 hypothetical protein [Gemmatimonadota bacterium]
MSQNSIAASSETLNEAAVANAWRQWGRIGVATSGSPGSSDVMVDPESLILGSLALAYRERRLADIAEEWLAENSDLVSISRLRALRPMLTGTDTDRELSGLAARVRARTGSASWRAVVSKPHRIDVPEDRQKRESSRKAVRVGRWRSGATTLLQLRLGLGLGVKPDVLAVLLGSAPEWLTTRELAELTGYSVPAVREALNDLTEAWWIESTGDRPAIFTARPSKWRELLRIDAEEHLTWRRYYDAFAFLAKWNATWPSRGATGTSGMDGYQAISRTRELWREHSSFFAAINVTREPTAYGARLSWDACAELFRTLADWFDEKSSVPN